MYIIKSTPFFFIKNIQRKNSQNGHFAIVNDLNLYWKDIIQFSLRYPLIYKGINGYFVSYVFLKGSYNGKCAMKNTILSIIQLFSISDISLVIF